MRDLGLPKDSAELLDQIKRKNLLATGTLIYLYTRTSRENEIILYFSQKDDLIYYNDIDSLTQKFGTDNEYTKRMNGDFSSTFLKEVYNLFFCTIGTSMPLYGFKSMPFIVFFLNKYIQDWPRNRFHVVIFHY